MPYTLTEITEEYLAERHIQSKKYFANYLIHASWAWKKMFFSSIYSVVSSWRELQFDGEDYFIEVPKGLLFLFSVSDIDRYGNLVELFYNSKMNVVKQDAQKCCRCGSNCGCGGACDDVNSLVVTTKYLFTNGGVDYYEKDWIEYCKNGDILLWREVPTKKYNDTTGDVLTDYNNDYNNDYVSPAFSNYTIVVEKFQEKLCSLDAMPCGCPKNTKENSDKINVHCGCFMPTWERHKMQRENLKTGNINNNRKGEVKLSPCGTKLIFKPYDDCKTIPKCLLVNFQTNGEDCEAEVIVPDYAVDIVKFGIDYRYKLFNNTFSPSEKKMAKYAYEEEITETIRLLNRFSFEEVSNIQDAKILF